jgi:hypothetical protein
MCKHSRSQHLTFPPQLKGLPIYSGRPFFQQSLKNPPQAEGNLVTISQSHGFIPNNLIGMKEETRAEALRFLNFSKMRPNRSKLLFSGLHGI